VTEHKVRVLSFFLIALSAVLLAKGTWGFFRPLAGQDFAYRWSTEQYVYAGIDPFPVAFWTSEHGGSPPPDLPPHVWAYAGNPVNVVDPPWVFAFGRILFPRQRAWARVWFLGVNYIALALTALLVYRSTVGFARVWRIFFTSIFFANFGFSQQIVNGNLGILSVLGITVVFVFLSSAALSGMGFALAQVKLTIGAPLGIVFLVKRRFLPLLIGAGTLGLGAIWTSKAVRASVMSMLTNMLEGAKRFAVGGTTPYQLFMLTGLSKQAALIICACLMGGAALWLGRKFAQDDLALMALFAVCSRIFTYHNVIDNVVLAFLVLTVARTWVETELDWKLGWLLMALVGSLLIPGLISNTRGAQIILQGFWTAAMGVVLWHRSQLRGGSQLPGAGQAGHPFQPEVRAAAQDFSVHPL